MGKDLFLSGYSVVKVNSINSCWSLHGRPTIEFTQGILTYDPPPSEVSPKVLIRWDTICVCVCPSSSLTGTHKPDGDNSNTSMVRLGDEARKDKRGKVSREDG